LFGIKDDGIRDSFFEDLHSGQGLYEGNPILALRNRLCVDTLTSKNLEINRHGFETGYVQLILMVRTWNVVRQGRSMTKITVGRPRTLDGKKLVHPGEAYRP